MNVLLIVFLVILFMAALGAGLKIQKKKVSTGTNGMAGLEGEVIKKLKPEGKVYTRGEVWSALSDGGDIKKGEKVIVEGVKGNILKVKKKEEKEVM